MSVNVVVLIGRLGKDPELKYTPAGRAVCNFSLATSRRWNAQDEGTKEATTWHNMVAWGKQAEVLNEHCHKGKEMYFKGRIDNRSYEDKEGVKKYISEVVVEEFQFIGPREDVQQTRGDATSPPDRDNKDDGSGLPF